MTVQPAEDPYKDVPHMRVLHCRTCKTLDELPDFDGPSQYDDTLNYVVKKHGEHHDGMLFRLPIGFWLMEETKRQIIEQIKGGGSGLAVMDSSFYETNNQFKEDAAKCYQLHLRPKGQCPDYMSDRKLLKPDTDADRKDAGLSPYAKSGGPKTTLCQFCVVHQYNLNKSRGA